MGRDSVYFDWFRFAGRGLRRAAGDRFGETRVGSLPRPLTVNVGVARAKQRVWVKELFEPCIGFSFYECATDTADRFIT